MGVQSILGTSLFSANAFQWVRFRNVQVPVSSICQKYSKQLKNELHLVLRVESQFYDFWTKFVSTSLLKCT